MTLHLPASNFGFVSVFCIIHSKSYGSKLGCRSLWDTLYTNVYICVCLTRICVCLIRNAFRKTVDIIRVNTSNGFQIGLHLPFYSYHITLLSLAFCEFFLFVRKLPWKSTPSDFHAGCSYPHITFIYPL